MTYLSIAVVLAVFVAGVSRLTRMALRHGHLLALRGPDGATALFERGEDGRYAPLPLPRLPAALRRFMCGVPSRVRVRARNGER